MSWTPEELPRPPLTLAQGIARMEGWYLKGDVPNRPQRNNNPGDVEFDSFTRQFGATLETGEQHPRFACFPDAESGWRCLDALLRTPAYANLTLAQAINRYAPPVENATSEYVDLVSHWTGISAGTLLSACLDLSSNG
jgi:hypothetical protein